MHPLLTSVAHCILTNRILRSRPAEPWRWIPDSLMQSLRRLAAEQLAWDQNAHHGVSDAVEVKHQTAANCCANYQWLRETPLWNNDLELSSVHAGALNNNSYHSQYQYMPCIWNLVKSMIVFLTVWPTQPAGVHGRRQEVAEQNVHKGWTNGCLHGAFVLCLRLLSCRSNFNKLVTDSCVRTAQTSWLNRLAAEPLPHMIGSAMRPELWTWSSSRKSRTDLNQGW